jgi:hypothetical protein
MFKDRIRTVAVAEDLQLVDAAITTIEAKMPYLVGLMSAERLSLLGMGPQNESFANQALQAAIQHPDLMPNGLSVAAIQADKDLREALLPRFERLRVLTTKMDNTILVLGSEFFGGALAIYKALQAFGKEAGITELLADLKRRFHRAKVATETTPTPNPEDPVI